jgi:hypothetical protein
LEGLDGANSRQWTLKSQPSYLRLFSRDPGDPDWLIVATFKPARAWAGKDVAADVARRAEARRSLAPGGDATGLEASELWNGGRRWLAQRPSADKFGRIVDTLSAKGLGVFGLG